MKSATSQPEAARSSGDDRLDTARDWLASQLGAMPAELSPVSGDASFRRYFRARDGDRTVILMDAPPEREDSRPFIDVAGRLREAGLRAPEIIAFDLLLGFGLLEDLGDVQYRDRIHLASEYAEIRPLFECLAEMALKVDRHGLPDYSDTRLQQELDLFTDWYLLRHRRITLVPEERATWDDACARLLQSAAEQPSVFVHRDFHSCNLMYQPGLPPGIIDFQDAVSGPVSYDFVSLAWDRYIAWPRERLEAWMEGMRQRLELSVNAATWIRWCDLMGLQRNLKIVGIFARLHYRDGKAGYREMIPRFYQYLLDVLPLYPEFSELLQVLRQKRCAP